MGTSLFKLTPTKGLILVLLTSALVLSPSLSNEWVNWDDDHYVLNNPLVHSLSIAQVGEMFSTLQVQGNYHPLTLLSLAVDYQIAGTDPFSFHLTNLIFHVLNTGWVFGFIYLLTNRLPIACLTALLFGVHPMHLESVAWISERKDVLYTFFFLGGLISYLFYVNGKKKKYLWLAGCIVAFLLSLLSKGMAVTFPVILLLIDYLKKRQDYKRLIWEKVPFFLLSLGFGILTILAQRAGQALTYTPDISLFESLITALNGLSLYTLKALIPYKLSALHPYPMIAGEALPRQMYLLALLTLPLGYLAWRGIRNSREISFGLGFYLVSLAPVLQLLPVGNAMIAERYTYIAYIGLFFLLGWAMDQLYRNQESFKKTHKTGIALLLGAYLLSMMFITVKRIPVWKNGETLWTDVMEKYPDHYYSYASRAMFRTDRQMPQKALEDFNEALRLNPGFVKGFINRGLIYAQSGDYQRAIADYDQAILLDSLDHLAYLNRGAVLRISKRPQEALRDLNRSIQLNPNFVMSYHNRGLVYKQLAQYESAIQDFSSALKLDKANPALWFERGFAQAIKGNLPQAEQDFTQAIALNPGYVQAFYYRSILYFDQGKKEAALQDALQAQKMGATFEDTYWERLRGE